MRKSWGLLAVLIIAVGIMALTFKFQVKPTRISSNALENKAEETTAPLDKSLVQGSLQASGPLQNTSPLAISSPLQFTGPVPLNVFGAMAPLMVMVNQGEYDSALYPVVSPELYRLLESKPLATILPELTPEQLNQLTGVFNNSGAPTILPGLTPTPSPPTVYTPTYKISNS